MSRDTLADTASTAAFGAPSASLSLPAHPLRMPLNNELHARAPLSVRPPARVTMLAMLGGDGNADLERRHLEALCAWAGAPRPAADASHFLGAFGTFRLRWERHTEYASWTILRPGGFSDPLIEPFAETALQSLPGDWVAGLPGEVIAAAHLAFLPEGTAEPDRERLLAFFSADGYLGSAVAGGAALVWTDQRIHGDGFGRFLVSDRGLRGSQAGRLVQRLMEIEIYRVLTLMALPVARSALPRLGELERDLAELTERTTRAMGLAEEREALDRLTRLAAETERLVAGSAYRFSAARAYHGIVERRIDELREVRIEGLQTFREFMDRRLTPAVRTCVSVEERSRSLSERVARASNLLRTRVEIAVEGQNAELLASMDRRALVQLRLQETVEGLSVVAISYYLVGLTGYAAKALKTAGLPVEPDIAIGIAVPVILLMVWRAIRQLRRAVTGRH